MSQAHILVIDDDQAVRDVLQETLTQEGYTVSTAADGTAGLNLAQEHPTQIALTDYQLPDLDGLEIIDRLTRLDAKIIPIMMTGFGTIQTAVRAMKARCRIRLAEMLNRKRTPQIEFELLPIIGTKPSGSWRQSDAD